MGHLAEALTWRELDVLQLMVGHHTNKEIARFLSIAEETVKKHAANIYGKLNVKGRRDAVIRAHDLGILSADAHWPSPSAVDRNAPTQRVPLDSTSALMPSPAKVEQRESGDSVRPVWATAGPKSVGARSPGGRR
jgi:DNA-binding CsgD family transcriptional regulator